MIGYLKGSIIFLQPGFLLLDVNGIGYELTISLQLYEKLSQSKNPAKNSEKTAGIWVHTIHKEDSFRLFGFLVKEERDFFRMLLVLPGVGPSMAMSLNSSLDSQEFISILKSNDVSMLTRIPGVGKSKAERIIFEFCKKYPKWVGKERKLDSKSPVKISSSEEEDAVLGLISLGYNSNQAELWVQNYTRFLIEENKKIPPAGEIIREALKLYAFKK